MRFAIPYDAGPGSDAEASPPISWHLEAEAEMPGVDFDVEFKVPVFKTDRSNPAFAAESAEDSASSTRDWAKELADAGIVSRTSPTGGPQLRAATGTPKRRSSRPDFFHRHLVRLYLDDGQARGPDAVSDRLRPFRASALLGGS